MSFGAPLVLIGLAAIPILGVWYASTQRRRARGQAAFVAAPLAASVAPRRAGWRRHVPLLAFAVALAALIVAVADPRTTQAEVVKSSTIVVASDVSGSMGATDVSPSRLRAVQAAVRRFLAQVPGRVSVGIETFDQTPVLDQSPTTDRAADRRALRGWRPHGGTSIGSAITFALGVIGRSAPAHSHPTAAIVLLSDGGSPGDAPLLAAHEAATRDIPIYTVALGTPSGTIKVREGNGTTRTVPVPPDPQLLARIARAAKGESFTTGDAGRLAAIYAGLGVKLGHRTVSHHLDGGFAGAALALLALGGGLSLFWFGRLI